MTVSRIPDRAPVDVGAVLTLPEEDYKFGRGSIAIRVLGVLQVVRLRDGRWLQVQAMQLRGNGTDWQRRFLLIRLAALSRPRSAG
jgi:hypothetical protein